jgi:AraC family transcriptional regulator
MEPKIVTIEPRKLVGMRMRMSQSSDRTPELFRSFMSGRKNIKNMSGTDTYCLQVFDMDTNFRAFTPEISGQR